MPQDRNNPLPISKEEWAEIMSVPDIADLWGLTEDETAEDFAAMVYGVKFNFTSDSPGYTGDLYILQGGGLSAPPVVLIRQEGKLELCSF